MRRERGSGLVDLSRDTRERRGVNKRTERSEIRKSDQLSPEFPIKAFIGLSLERGCDIDGEALIVWFEH
jgi:hypothetical protein